MFEVELICVSEIFFSIFIIIYLIHKHLYFKRISFFIYEVTFCVRIIYFFYFYYFLAEIILLYISFNNINIPGTKENIYTCLQGIQI